MDVERRETVMPDQEEQKDQQTGKQQAEKETEKGSETDHHIPVPPKKKRHRKQHWGHLPDSKRKSIRSYKSPGRK
jgi:hypothetical protein